MDCNYKNHRIFTLRCIHKELVPVSIRLKTTLRTEKARKTMRTAEKQILQARITSINSILDNYAKQRELCRSKLASILSTSNFRKCQVFVEKVGEFRFNKVKTRQVIKFNNLLCKKEGNITWETSQATRVIASSLQAGRQAPPSLGQHGFPGSQCGSPISTPSREGHSQEGSNSQADNILVSSQAGRQATPFPGTVQLPRKPAQPPSSIPSREGHSQEGSNSQADNILVSSQAGRQATPFPGTVQHPRKPAQPP